MSNMSSSISRKIIGIFCSDIHLSHTAPVWRSEEKSWYNAMRRPLKELKLLQEKYNCPIFCAGDVFDRWNSPAELINFALENLPDMYAIAGQHDLPLHNLEEIEKSAFWTLVKANKIKLLNLEKYEDDYLIVTGNHYGQEQYKVYPGKKIKVHLMHKYIWKKGYSYPNAPEEGNINKLSKNLKNNKIDIYVYGDNHKGFIDKINDITIFNCGGFMRRKSDEVDYKPHIGLLTSNKEIILYYLDTSNEKYLKLNNTKLKTEEFDMTDLSEELKKLDTENFDFKEAVKNYFNSNNISKEIKNIILEAMENGLC